MSNSGYDSPIGDGFTSADELQLATTAAEADATAAAQALDAVAIAAHAVRLTALEGVAITTGLIGARPSAGAGQRGRVYIALGGAGVADVAYVCVKDSLDAYSWKTVTLT